MKNLSLFSLMFMIGMVLFIGGCAKDDDKYVSKEYDDTFFQKSYVTKLLKKEGAVELRSSRDVDDLIDKVSSYIQTKNLGQTKAAIQQRYGYPVWNATEFIRETNKVTTITPIVNTNTGAITNFFLTSSTKPGVSLILKKYMTEWNYKILDRFFSNKLDGIENDVNFRGTGETSGVSGGATGGGGLSFDCETHVELTTLYSAYWYDGFDLGLSGSFIENPDGSFTHDVETSWGVMTTDYDISVYQDCIENDPNTDIFSDGPGSTTSSGGGGGAGSNCYHCNISSWEDCKEKMESLYGTKNFMGTEDARKKLFDECQGCATAFFWTNMMVSYYENSASEKVKCLMCNGYPDQIFNILKLNSVELPCEENPAEFIDDLIPECGTIDESNPETQFSWNNIKKKLNATTWFLDEYSPTKESSENISQMGSFFGLSFDQIKVLPSDELCSKLTIMDCLKPSPIGAPQGMVSNAEKAQLLDFYKNAELLNACSGELIDKDGLFKNLCENDEMSLLGLNAALENVSHINLLELPIHKSDCSKTDEQNIADFSSYMLQNGGCSGTGFQNALESYLGIGSTVDSGNPILSVNNAICGDVFKVSSHSSKPNTFVTGISDLQLSFDVGASLPLIITFDNLLFENNATNCEYSFSTAVANSINSAIATMQFQINKHLQDKLAGLPTKPLTRIDLYTFIHRAYQEELKHCTPHHGTTVGNVSLLADGSPNCGGAEYVILNEDDCP